MEFTVAKTDLLRELGLSQRIVEKRNTIPILANILIETDKDGFNLTATALEDAVLGDHGRVPFSHLGAALPRLEEAHDAGRDRWPPAGGRGKRTRAERPQQRDPAGDAEEGAGRGQADHRVRRGQTRVRGE